MPRSAAPPEPPPAALTLMATALGVALVVVMAPPTFIAKLSAPAPFVFALMVTGPLPAPPTLALRVIASPLERGTAPVPVEVAPVTPSRPVVRVGLCPPPPGAVAVKFAPSASVTVTPPEPLVAVTAPAVVRTGAPGEPMPLATAGAVGRVTAPAPALRRGPHAC